jgi:hypothetical protein
VVYVVSLLLLAESNTLTVVPSGLLFLCWLYELNQDRRLWQKTTRRWTILGFAAVGYLSILFQLIGPPDRLSNGTGGVASTPHFITASSVLITLILVVMHRYRYKQPLLYCLALCLAAAAHSIFIPPVVLLAIWWIYTATREQLINRKILALCSGTLVVIVSFFSWLQPIPRSFNILELIVWPETSNVFTGLLVLVLLGAAYIYLLSMPERRALVAAYIFSLYWMFFIILFKHPFGGGIRHYWLIPLVTIFFLWIGSDGIKRKSTRRLQRVEYAMLLTLLLSTFSAFNTIIKDKNYLFSGSTDAAQYINANYPGASIASEKSAPATAILPYVHQSTFFYTDLQMDGSYINWNKTYGEKALYTSPQTAAERASMHFGNTTYLLITSSPLSADVAGYQLVHVSPTDFISRNEAYWIYLHHRP